jgi:hypothetical protein
MEFASCQACNNETSPADLVASFVARISPVATHNEWQTIEACEKKGKLEQIAPGFLSEFFQDSQSEHGLIRINGLLRRTIKIGADGPLTRTYLLVFSAKIAMAIYRERIGSALPLHGGVEVMTYLNAGLAQSQSDKFLSIMPASATLQQGSVQVGEQFFYRYNDDGHSIVAALVRFHQGLYVTFVATSNPSFYGFPLQGAHSTFVRPGEIMHLMPPKQMNRRLGGIRKMCISL